MPNRNIEGVRISDRAEEIWRDSPVIDASLQEKFDAEGLGNYRNCGVTGMFSTLGVLGPRGPMWSYENAVWEIAEYQGMFLRYPELIVAAYKASDIRRAKDEKKCAIVMGFQNAVALGYYPLSEYKDPADRHISSLQQFYDLGVRWIQLTHNERNYLGNGSTERRDEGLSDFGVAVVEEMNRLGILVDLAHCGPRTTADAIELSKKPAIFTHTACQSVFPHPRNKPDELIRKLAERGGVICIMTTRVNLTDKTANVTTAEWLDHLEHAIKVAGVEHVGIGSDTDLRGWRAAFHDEATFLKFYTPLLKMDAYKMKWPIGIDEIDHPREHLVIVQRLLERGYSRSDIEKVVGRNLLRLCSEVLG